MGGGELIAAGCSEIRASDLLADRHCFTGPLRGLGIPSLVDEHFRDVAHDLALAEAVADVSSDRECLLQALERANRLPELAVARAHVAEILALASTLLLLAVDRQCRLV